MNQKNIALGNPVFAYFSRCSPGSALPGGLSFDAFRVRAADEMHDVFLGCVSEVAAAFANRVLEAGKEAISRFKRATLSLHSFRLKGFNMTLWRPQDARSSSETSFLHLLSKKRLFAREYQEALPLLPILFHAACVERIDSMIAPFCDLVVFCTMIQMRCWPTNAPDVWWNRIKDFGLQTYQSLQTGFPDELAKDRELVVPEPQCRTVWIGII